MTEFWLNTQFTRGWCEKTHCVGALAIPLMLVHRKKLTRFSGTQCSVLFLTVSLRNSNKPHSLALSRTHMANQSHSTSSQALLTCSYQQQLQSKYVGILVFFDRHNGFLIWSQNLNNLLAYLTFCSSSGMVLYGCKIARQSIMARTTKWIISSVKLCSLQHTHTHIADVVPQPSSTTRSNLCVQ